MRSSKQKQEFNNTSTNTATSSVADSPDIQALRAYKAPVDPGLKYQYSRLRKQVENSFRDPTGGYYAPQVRDAIVRSSQAQLGQDEAEAMQQGQYQSNVMDLGRLSGLADLTAARTTTGSGTQAGTGTVTQTPSALSTASQIAGSVAQGFA